VTVFGDMLTTSSASVCDGIVPRHGEVISMLPVTHTPTPAEVREHMLNTYWWLRMGLIVMAGALPTAMLAYSLFHGGTLKEGSISAFYGAYDNAMRNWFVGELCAVGAILILYRGLSFMEDMMLNAGGLFAVLTAFTPCNCWSGQPESGHSKLHGFFGIAFFLCMAYVCAFCARRTTALLSKTDQKKFLRKYFWIATSLAVWPFAALIVGWPHGEDSLYIFALETIGIAIFGYYWWTKTAEYKLNAAEKLAFDGHLVYADDGDLMDVRHPRTKK
jgi:hypothetical protein